MAVKRCPDCKCDKDYSEYYLKDGKPSAYCKKCYLLRNSAWSRANRDKENSLFRAWYQKNKKSVLEKNKKYFQENPEVQRSILNRRRARQRGAEGCFSPADIKRLLVLQKNKCAICKIVLVVTKLTTLYQ